MFFLSCALLLLPVACSSDRVNEGTADVATDIAADAAADVPADIPECDPATGTVETKLSKTALPAAESTVVSCSLVECPELAGEGFDFLVAGEKGVDHDIAGNTVSFGIPGEYEIACTYTDSTGVEKQDVTPAVVVVKPGPPAEIETVLTENEVPAGTNVVVGCAGKDEYDNPVYGKFSLLVTPDAGVGLAGLVMTPTVAGEYEIVCVLDGVHEGAAPVKLKVVPDVPRKVYTSLSDDTVVAGKSVNISCEATDKWDNKVGGFPLAVYAPPQLSLSGLSIGGTVAGFYDVMCVPPLQDWELFALFPQTLTVVPDEPGAVKLTVVPQKLFYKVLDKVNLQVAVLDKFDNLLPDEELLPVEIKTAEGLATNGVVEILPFTFKFLEEEHYILTVKVQADPAMSGEVMIKVDGTGPLLSIDYPERGATIGDKPSVTVTGTVGDKSGLVSFTIDGEDVDVEEDNSFSHIVIRGHAVNPLVAEAEDPDGQATRTVQAFAFSDKYYAADGPAAETFVPSGIELFLSENFVDDGNHDPSAPDDLATVMELLLANLDFGALIPNPVFNANNYQVFVKNVSMSPPTVQMDLVEGGMTVNVSFSDFSADVDAVGSCNVLGVDICPDVGGTLIIEDVSFYATLAVGLDGNNQPAADITEFHLGLEGVKLDLSGLGSLLEPVLNALISIFEQQVEAALASQVEQMLPGVVEELFSQFELDETIPIAPIAEGSDGTSINLETRYSRLELSPAGISISLDARASSLKKVLHKPLGSIGRGGCAGADAPEYEMDTSHEVTVGVADDLLNQLLFSVWWSGALNFKLTEDNLESLSDTLESYGIEEPQLSLDFFLAPILSDCNGDKALRLGVGDLYVEANFKMLGVPLSVGLFVTARGEASIQLAQGDGGPSIDLTVAGISAFDYDVVSVTEGFPDLVPIMEELLAQDVLEAGLDNIAGKSFSGLKLPEIDLSGLVQGIPPGTQLTISPATLLRKAGYTEITGVLE